MKEDWMDDTTKIMSRILKGDNVRARVDVQNRDHEVMLKKDETGTVVRVESHPGSTMAIVMVTRDKDMPKSVAAPVETLERVFGDLEPMLGDRVVVTEDVTSETDKKMAVIRGAMGTLVNAHGVWSSTGVVRVGHVMFDQIGLMVVPMAHLSRLIPRGMEPPGRRVLEELRVEIDELKTFVRLGMDIGELLVKKNEKYGNSFAVIDKFFELLYPNGIVPAQYQDALLLARIFDKMMRIATDARAFGESPYRDIAGYAILGLSVSEKSKTEEKDA
jgi:hypothetical protein